MWPQMGMTRRKPRSVRKTKTHITTCVFSSDSWIRMLLIDGNYTQICFRGAWQQQQLVWSLTPLFFWHERIPINRLTNKSLFKNLFIFVCFYPVHFSLRCTWRPNLLRSFYTNQKFTVCFNGRKTSSPHNPVTLLCMNVSGTLGRTKWFMWGHCMSSSYHLWCYRQPIKWQIFVVQEPHWIGTILVMCTDCT